MSHIPFIQSHICHSVVCQSSLCRVCLPCLYVTSTVYHALTSLCFFVPPVDGLCVYVLSYSFCLFIHSQTHCRHTQCSCTLSLCECLSLLMLFLLLVSLCLSFNYLLIVYLLSPCYWTDSYVYMYMYTTDLLSPSLPLFPSFSSFLLFIINLILFTFCLPFLSPFLPGLFMSKVSREMSVSSTGQWCTVTQYSHWLLLSKGWTCWELTFTIRQEE